MARIAIGGFQHETNTFAPSKADYAAFEDGGGWPGVRYGAPIFAAVQGANIPAEGAIQALRAMGHALVGSAWGAASPSAHVTDDAFERVMAGMLQNLREALPVDGVYLDLHGAMVTESHDDGEGEILRRVRELVGPRVPVVASLDLHANVTRNHTCPDIGCLMREVRYYLRKRNRKLLRKNSNANPKKRSAA